MVDNAQVNFINTQAKSMDNACLKKDTDRLLFSEKNWRFSNFHRLEKRQILNHAATWPSFRRNKIYGEMLAMQ